jgi:hypothetical protein
MLFAYTCESNVVVGSAAPLKDIRCAINGVAFGGDYIAYCEYSLMDRVTPDSAWVAVDMGDDLGWRVVAAHLSFQQASALLGVLLETRPCR